MALSRFFRKAKAAPERGFGGDFWADVTRQCANHILNMLAIFKSQDTPYIDWVEPRFLQLATPQALTPVLAHARKALARDPTNGCIMPEPVLTSGNWHICVSVYPSDSDAAFLARCPERSYEELARGARRAFRSVPGWMGLDWAHWLLLVDEGEYVSSVHLQTLWNTDQCLAWAAQGLSKGQVAVELAPEVVPLDLLKEPVLEFISGLYREDVQDQSQAAQSKDGQRRPTELSIERRIARIVLMDSILSEIPAEPADPVSWKTGGDQSRSLIDQVLEAHLKDCRQLAADIPLVLGAPFGFIEPVGAYLRRVRYGGLKPEQVSIVPEPQAPGVRLGNEAAAVGGKSNKEYLLGGGACLALLIESGELHRLWKRGIRWLFISQFANPGAHIDARSLVQLSGCRADGLAEVVERSALPGSKVVVLVEQPGGTHYVDDRRLRSPEAAKFRSSPYVGTGSFWIRCEKLAQVFGIDHDLHENEWDVAQWAGKLMSPLLERHAITGLGEDLAFWVMIPAWEVLSTLELEPVRAGA